MLFPEVAYDNIPSISVTHGDTGLKQSTESKLNVVLLIMKLVPQINTRNHSHICTLASGLIDETSKQN